MSFGKFINPSVNPTIGTDAYTANDVVGGLLQFNLTGLVINGGILNQVILVDEDSIGEAFKLYLFEAEPSTIADDAAFAPTIADLNKLVAVIDFAGNYVTVNSLDYNIVDDINNVFSSSVGILYGYLVCTGTPNFTNDDALTIRLYIASEQ